MKGGRKINLKVPFITRLEGEGSLELTARGDDIEKLHLRIFEPPRLFEKFLEGKAFHEVPDLCARICGICPMAYQLTSIQAIEALFGVELPEHITNLRRLMNLGEWLQSHALHIHFLAMPDFLGFNTALEMAGSHPDLLKRGMLIQEAGNRLMQMLGGRSVHPVGLQVGGFSRLPKIDDWQAAKDLVERAYPEAEALFKWTAKLNLPDTSHGFTSVSLHDGKAYPINGGQIVSNDGLNISAQEYLNHFKEHQVRHSTAFYSLLDGKDYLVGPLARMNNNFQTLPEPIQTLASQNGIRFPNQNMFTSIQARALECVWALHEARILLNGPHPTGEANVAFSPVAGACSNCTEAPRGLIFHHYRLDSEGRVEQCTIIPPTSQNQARIEKDLHYAVRQYGLDRTDGELKSYCEQVIRNYDPCISCSTHFLDFKLTRK